MHRLHYSPDSLINSVDVAKTAGGSTRAYLHANPNASFQQLQAVRADLQAQGWSVTPYNLDGEPTLEVRGFGKEKKLAGHLSEKGFAKGTPKQEGESKTGFGAWVKENTFMIIGGLYWIGDWSYILYGKLNQARIDSSNKKREAIGIAPNLEEKAWQNTAAGAAYFAGSGVASIWGRNRSERQYRDIACAIEEHYEEKGLKLPEGTAIAHTAENVKSGPWARFNNFMGKYTAEITNGFFGLAGVFIFLYGVAKRKDQIAKGHQDWAPAGEMAVGISSAMAGLVSILVKEKHATPEEKAKRGPLGKAWAWVQERPLSLAATFLGISTGTHAVLTAGEIYKNKRDIARLEGEVRRDNLVPDGAQSRETQARQIDLDDVRAELRGNYFRGAFVASNIAAEGAMLTGKKTHGEGVEKDKSVVDSVVAGVAEIIQRGGFADRETAVREHAKLLSDNKLLGAPAEEIARQLETHLSIADHNPWAAKPAIDTRPAQQNERDAVRENDLPAQGKWVAAHQERMAAVAQAPQAQHYV